MMKKLVVVLMAVLFSFSVAGLSFADEPKQPYEGKEMKEMEMKKEEPKKAKKKPAKKKEDGPTMPAPAPA
ncbi:MAG TPA: histone [Patescibacteria group bacterium]|nr:histone [Patescibacteria group bacterium]